MNAIRISLILGAIPVVVGLSYLVLQAALGTDATVDAAGVLLLVALGLAMGFGMLVILHGARDIGADD